MKTKLEMAHDYAVAMLETPAQLTGMSDKDIAIAAFNLAEAMQAEADKREKEQQSEHVFEAVDEWQPDWSQAPEWANWWSVDENGTANFSGKKPNIEGRQWVYYSAASESPCHIEAPSFGYTGDWRNSLRKRPQ